MEKRAHVRDEGGMTLVEVMVAMVILLVGVLGVAMLDIGSKVTSENLAVTEPRGWRASNSNASARWPTPAWPTPTVAAQLIPLGGSSAPRRDVHDDPAGRTYTTTISSCVVDDPPTGSAPCRAPPASPCRPPKRRRRIVPAPGCGSSWD